MANRSPISRTNRRRTPSPLKGNQSSHWNPNFVCDITRQNQEASLEVAREKRNVLLVAKLLELEKPVVTNKMVAFLRQGSVPYVLCNFLTRAAPFAEKEYNGGPADTTPRAGLDISVSDPMELHALKMSHKAAILLINPVTAPFVTENLELIIPELFRIFEPNARGNFHHLLFVIKKLIGDYSEELLSIAADEHLLCATLPFVHHAPVAELVVIMLTSGMEMPMVRQVLYQELVKCQFLPQIVSIILNCDNADRASDCLYFLFQLIDALQVEMHADLLFSSLGERGLLDTLCMGCGVQGDFQPFQRRLCVELVHMLLKKSEVSEITPLTVGGKPLKFHNMVAVLQKTVVDAVSRHGAGIAQAAVPLKEEEEEDVIEESGEEEEEEEKLNSPRPILRRHMSDLTAVAHGKYQVDRLFTSERLLLLEILAHAAAVSPDQVMDSVKPYFWRRLVNWLFEYPQNSMYHNVFFQLFRSAMLSDHWPSMVVLFSRKVKLIERLYHGYKTEPDLHGHVILLCNVIRLKVSTLAPSAFLRKRVLGHREWDNMISDIIADTKLQSNCRFELQKGLYSHFAPGIVLALDSQGRPPRRDVDLGPTDDEGVELGSAFANQLGFIGAAVFSEEKEDFAERLAQEVEEELSRQATE